MEQIIKLLNKTVSDLIAAGEVVDRPLSVVKELVENSIDAGASSIVIEIRKGGKEYIRVTDNGSGIPENQVNMAFQRHATSKIQRAEDLGYIETLGFRGEALASISSVSKMEVITKTKESQTGSKTVIHGGETKEHVPTGCPDGTTMIVRDLFFNTPARLKFMKSDSAESSAVIDFAAQMALAYPEIRIRMISNGNILFSTRGTGDRRKVIMTLSGNDPAMKLLPLEITEGNIYAKGYISGPGESKASRKGQIYFVNGRAISSKILEKAVDSAYSDRLFEGRFPIIYLFLEISPSEIDVNIHPNKREVRFNDEKNLTSVLIDGIKEALTVKEAVPDMDINGGPHVFQTPDNGPEKEMTVEQVDIKTILSSYRHEAEKIKDEIAGYKAGYGNKEPRETIHIEKYTEVKPFDFAQIQVTGSIFGSYITATDHDNFYLIDQHAAHERIIFEKLMTQFNGKLKVKQPIMIPSTFSTDPAISDNDEKWISILDALGFSVEDFGPGTYIIKEIPMFLSLSEAEKFVKDFLDTYSENTDISQPEQIKKITGTACKSAVKANDYLTEEEIEELMNTLSKCENPFSCPHGRPTFIKFSKADIEKRFGRT